MRTVLLSMAGCPPCEQAKVDLHEWLSSGDIEEIDVLTNEEGVDFLVQAMDQLDNAESAAPPLLVLVDHQSQVFMALDVGDGKNVQATTP